MMQMNRVVFELAQERREREIADAAEHARARQDQPDVNPVRRALGRSMISIGARLANEPQARLARSQ
jgi:hypothetical protein